MKAWQPGWVCANQSWRMKLAFQKLSSQPSQAPWHACTSITHMHSGNNKVIYLNKYDALGIFLPLPALQWDYRGKPLQWTKTVHAYHGPQICPFFPFKVTCWLCWLLRRCVPYTQMNTIISELVFFQVSIHGTQVSQSGKCSHQHRSASRQTAQAGHGTKCLVCFPLPSRISKTLLKSNN